MRDRHEKIISRLIFWERIVAGLGFFAFVSTIFIYVTEGNFFMTYGTFFLIYMYVNYGIFMLPRQRKTCPFELSDTPIYEHSIERKEKKTHWLGRLLASVAKVLFLLLVLFFIFFVAHKEHVNSNSWLLGSSYALLGTAFTLWVFRELYCFWNYEPEIKITLLGEKLNVSYPNRESWHSDDAFPIDEIIEARIVTAEDQRCKDFITNSGFIARPNEKIKRGPYMYAFFLSDKFPLPDGHQAVELKLKNGRHVLIETDDAENFLAALRKSGAGGGC